MSAPAAASARDRWRFAMLLALAALQVALCSRQVPAAWADVAGWLADPDQRRITRPFWLHLDAVGVTLANVILLAGALGAAFARGRSSQRWLLRTFAVYLALMVGARLPPLAWSYDPPPELAPKIAEILAASAPLTAVAGCVDLVPLLIAISFGLARAGQRQARRGVARSLGVTLVVVTSLQLALTAAAALVFLQPLLPQSHAPLGLLLVTVHFALQAVGWYGMRQRDQRSGGLLRIVLAGSAPLLLLPGLGLVLFDLYRAELFGMHLVAIGEQAGLVSADELPFLGVLFAARSVAMAVAASDLIERSDLRELPPA